MKEMPTHLPTEHIEQTCISKYNSTWSHNNHLPAAASNGNPGGVLPEMWLLGVLYIVVRLLDGV